MGMTLTQKILADHAGLASVEAGQLIEARLNLALGNDVTTPPALNVFNQSGATEVFDKDKVVFVPDHFTPNKDIKSAEHCRQMRQFAKKFDITHSYEQGEAGMGIEHVILPENGLVMPGDVIIGADSHTCTYGALGAFATGVGSTDLAFAMVTGETWFKVPGALRFNLTNALEAPVSGKDLILHIIGMIGVDGALYKSMEFTGPGVASLDMSDRLTICNMAIEAGAKNGIFPVDEKTVAYLNTYAPDRVAAEGIQALTADPDAQYEKTYEIDLSQVQLTVAFPHLPENARTFDQIGDIPIDQVVIGSCTNGRIEDMRVAAKFLKGHKVSKGLRLIIIPGSQRVYRQALREGLFEIFIDAGAVVSAPTCGPCLGGHMGILAAGERCVSTTNRNFVGRMGHPESEVYLAGVPVAVASAVMGKVASPAQLPAKSPAAVESVMA